MALSVRLDSTMEKKIGRVARQRSMRKSDVVRYCLERFLDEMPEEKGTTAYQAYLEIEKDIPGSGDGELSVNHRQRLLEIIKKRNIPRP